MAEPEKTTPKPVASKNPNDAAPPTATQTAQGPPNKNAIMLSAELRESDNARQQRINAQCWLTENLNWFAAPKNRPSKYKHLTVFDGDARTLQQVLTAKGSLEGFMELNPHQIAAMVPFVDIYVVKSDDPKSVKRAAVGGKHGNASKDPKNRRKVLFANWTTQASIKGIMDGTNPRGAACGLKEFTYECDGGQAGGKEAKRTRIATLKFVAESLAALDTRVPGFASPLDLAMEPPLEVERVTNAKSERVSNPDSYIIRINYGWEIPKDHRNIPGLNFTESQVEQIKNQVTSLLLHQSDLPKMTFNEDGSVELELTYIAAVELADDGRDKNMDVLALKAKPRSQDHEIKANTAKKRLDKAEAKKMEIAKKAAEELKGNAHQGGDHVNDDGKKAADASGVNKKGATAADVNAKTLTNELRKEDQREQLKKQGKNAGEIAKNLEDADKEFKEASAKYAALTEDPLLKKWSAILGYLAEHNKIHTAQVDKQLFGIAFADSSDRHPGHWGVVGADGKRYAWQTDCDDKTKNPTVGHVENCKKKNRQYVAYRAAGGANNDEKVKVQAADAKKNTMQKDSAQTAADKPIGSLKQMQEQKAMGKGGAAEVKRLAEGVSTGTSHIPIDPTGTYLIIHYLYLGDLISAAVDRAYAASGLTKKDRSRLLMGPMVYKDFSQGTYRTVPIADIPISFKLFQAWLMHTIIGPQRTSMGLQQFLTAIVKDLIVPALSGGPNSKWKVGGSCFHGSNIQQIGDTSSGIGFLGFEVEELNGGDPLQDVPRLNTNDLYADRRRFQRKKGPDPRTYTPELYRYVAISTNISPPPRRTGNYHDDAKDAVYHIGYNHEKGPTTSITFERVDQDHLNTTEDAAGKGTNAGIGVGGMPEIPHTCTVKMVGNNLFDLMSEFYIDIGSIGTVKEYMIAQALGFGGYFQCSKLHGSINENGWEQTVEGYPVPGFWSKARNEWLGSRKGLFTGKAPNYEQKKKEAAQAERVRKGDVKFIKSGPNKDCPVGTKIIKSGDGTQCR